MFRKALLYIRKNYNNTDGRLKFLIMWGIICLVSVLAGVAVDIFLPFGTSWNLIRTAILVPSAASAFVLAYSLSLFLHYRKIERDYTWEPYRARYSASTRRRLSLIAAAIGFIFLYATGMRPGYTFATTMFILLVISLFAFMRPTKAEARREVLDIPDARDVRYDRLKEQVAEEQAQKERMKNLRKKHAKEDRKKTAKQRREAKEETDDATPWT